MHGTQYSCSDSFVTYEKVVELSLCVSIYIYIERERETKVVGSAVPLVTCTRLIAGAKLERICGGCTIALFLP